MTSWELRQRFLRYFASRGHEVVPSSSLIPAGDPTLLFTNAGMVPFKDIFLGIEKTSRKRAVSIQKCVRAGGKHNDLDRVGFTRRHHTFFEMMGNFSFGDYFKKEAISFAWEFLTVELGLDKNRLWITVFRDDDEAFELWQTVSGMPPERIVRLGEKDNFWQMGETGPCGPCSEILYDQGSQFSCGSEDCRVGCDCDRYLEIWNLVFMQFNRERDQTLTPLPKPSIDTGMGLERLAAVVQGVDSNFETDLFLPLIETIQQYVRIPYEKGAGPMDYAFRVVSDHMRSSVLLLHEGLVPSNEGRGYVLRRIIRRAVQFGRELGLPAPFTSTLADRVAEMMKGPYPELESSLMRIKTVLEQEERRFHKTLEEGLPILEGMLHEVENKKEKVLPGDMLFLLHDTHGFPLDVAEDIARSRSISLDFKGFEEKMEEQRERGRASWVGKAEEFPVKPDRLSEPVLFAGYDRTGIQGALLLLIKDEKEVKEANEGDQVIAVVSPTVFYPEGGGQVGDTGNMIGPFGYMRVEGSKKPYPGWIVLFGTVRSGRIRVGETMDQHVDEISRKATERHHTATHLLHAALRHTLGDHVRQAGSLVAPDRLRFDFTYPGPLSKEDLDSVEDLVNSWIVANFPVGVLEVEKQKALDMGALAFFDEKYGETVRVVQVPGTSTELCGGTHVHRTGDLGAFYLIQESGISAGVRRIEAVAGQLAYRKSAEWRKSLDTLRDILGSGPTDVIQKATLLTKENTQNLREIQALKTRLFVLEESASDQEAIEIKGHRLVVSHAMLDDPKDLRGRLDAIKNRVPSGAILLLGESREKAVLLGWASPDVAVRFPVSNWVKIIADELGGRGGGKPTWAEGGGPKPASFPALLESVRNRAGEAFRLSFE